MVRRAGGREKLVAGLFRGFHLRWLFVALLAFPAGLFVWSLIEQTLFGTSASHSVNLHVLLFAPLLWFTTGKIFIDPGPWGEETGWRFVQAAATPVPEGGAA